MAKTDLNTIRNWFKNGLKPTQEQFWAWLDSFWHKDDKIPAENIQGLNEMLSGIDLSSKVENADFESFKTSNSKELNQKVDKEVGKGLSTNDFTEELKNKLENFSNIATADQTIDEGVERSIDVQGRLNITGLEEVEVSDEQYSKILMQNSDGTLALKNAENLQFFKLLDENGNFLPSSEKDLNKYETTGFFIVENPINSPFSGVSNKKVNVIVLKTGVRSLKQVAFSADWDAGIWIRNRNAYNDWSRSKQNRVKWQRLFTQDDYEYTHCDPSGVPDLRFHTNSLLKRRDAQAVSFTINLQEAKVGMVNYLFFRASELPVINNLIYKNSEIFKPNVAFIIKFTYVGYAYVIADLTEIK
uniref:hypothetical protein n=1 Tax=Ornithobacterium rhinotracheale TaxID=28251 RepID=UPI0039A574A6